jgi:hypothetical protein
LFRLSTGKEIVHDQFSIMPMNDVVINAMNKLADAPVVEIRGRVRKKGGGWG